MYMSTPRVPRVDIRCGPWGWASWGYKNRSVE